MDYNDDFNFLTAF